MGRRKQQPPQTRQTAGNTAAATKAGAVAVVDEDDDSMDVDVVYVKLKTSDGKYFNFTETEASCSSALRQMLDSSRQFSDSHNGSSSAVNKADYVLLQSIDSKVLSKIQQWCKMHSYNQSSVASNCDMSCHEANFGRPPCEADSRVHEHDEAGQRPQAVDTWDMKYLASFSEPDLLRIANAANFLDMKDLYDACCKFMAVKWEGMKVEDIRAAYNIHDDFAVDEEIQIIQDNKKIGLTE